MSVERPKRPWELALERVMRSAFEHTDREVEDVVVEGRACYLVYPDRSECYLLPREVVRDAIELVDASEMGTESKGLTGEIVIEPWDEDEGAIEIDDGRTWADDPDGGHWCLNADACETLRRTGIEGLDPATDGGDAYGRIIKDHFRRSHRSARPTHIRRPCRCGRGEQLRCSMCGSQLAVIHGDEMHVQIPPRRGNPPCPG